MQSKTSDDNFLAKGVTWNLKDLYASPDDPKIQTDLKSVESKSIAFEKKYKPLFEKTDQNFPIAALLTDYKDIAMLMTRLGVFSHLAFAEQTNAPGIGAFMQKIRVALTDIQSHLLFFDVCWSRLDEKTAQKLMSSPQVGPDIHFLEKMRMFAPYTLGESEEKIMAIKSNTSGPAFSRLFDEIMNNIPFYIEENGKKVKKSEAEVLSLFHSKNREERKHASGSLAEGLSANTHVLTYIYNMILADHRSSMKIRGYTHPMDSMNLSNEISLETVTNLIKSVKKAYPIAHRYYNLKKKLLGLNELYDHDRYAPVDINESKIGFDQCREIVLSGYYEFSEEAGKIAEQFFVKRWIDAEIRSGKQGGGFCAQTTPDLHPYILVNYTGSARDVMTVAHELGHGLHQYLAGRRVGILQSDAPLTMAETASVFGEMLIFEKILSSETDSKKRLALLCGKIDDNFATVYRQICMTDFELMSHEAGLTQGEISSDKFSDFWIKANSEFYGKSVILTENYRHGWKYIPHFIHSPFYCYAYSFAQIFVLTLFQKYKQDKKSFIPKYLEMLSLGGSKKPEDIAAIAGLNLRDPGFFDTGIKLLDKLVTQAEELSEKS